MRRATARRSCLSRPRGVFFGTSEFAVPSLEAFARAVDCVLVVTQPDRPSGRGLRLVPTPVKAAALERGIPTIEPPRVRDAVEAIRAADADLFAVASYGQIVPRSVLDLPRLGALNVHPSMLPLYRGATPLQSQLRDGVVRGGVTIIAMDAGMDTGDIVLAEAAAIAPDDTYGTLHDRLAALGATLLERACALVVAGEADRVPQAVLGDAEAAARTRTAPLGKADLAVDWTWDADRIERLVRSLSPQPLARADLAGEAVKLVRARAARAGDAVPPGAPGTFVADGAACVVACGAGALAVERLIAPNRGETGGGDFARRAVAREGALR